MRKDTGPGWNRSAYSRRSIGQERHLFWLLAALSLAGYALLGWWMPLVPNVPRTPEGLPLPDISSFAPWPWGTLAYGLLLAALFGLYWLAYRAIQAVTPARPAQDATPEFQNLPQPLPLRYLLSKADRLRRDSLVQILAPVVLFGVVLVGTFPFNATDIFRYWITTRITAAPALNPYEVAVEDLGDPRLTSLAGRPQIGIDIKRNQSARNQLPARLAIAFSIFALTSSRLKLAARCMGGNSSADCASFPTSFWIKTNRQNTNAHHSAA